MNDLHGIIFAYRSDANLGELTRPGTPAPCPSAAVPPGRLHDSEIART